VIFRGLSSIGKNAAATAGGASVRVQLLLNNVCNEGVCHMLIWSGNRRPTVLRKESKPASGTPDARLAARFRLPIVVIGLMFALHPGSSVQALRLADHPQLIAIVDDLVLENGFERAQLEQWFESAEIKDSVVKAMRRPAERLKWHQYLPLFIGDETIKNGVRFIADNETAFDRALGEYGVPVEVIAAIIGVETRYGKVTGKHRIIDSLSSLVVGYPRRSEFFASELHSFLLLAREEKMNPVELKGSYAGAMGIPQFIASSYRSYAIDFDDDGVRDLIGNRADAIGSVANYLAIAGWKPDEAIVSAVEINPAIDPETLINKGRKGDFELARLTEAGVKVTDSTATAGKVGLIGLDDSDGRIYRVGYTNYFAIMRYNPSQLYAMAVYELSQAIKEAM